MTPRERFLVLFCSYVGLMKTPDSSLLWIERFLTEARHLPVSFEDPEQMAWEYARWAVSRGPRPSWVPV